MHSITRRTCPSRCSDACDSDAGWRFSFEAWQWDALWVTALTGTITLWLSVAAAVAAAGMGALPRARAAAPRAHLLAAVVMAIAVVSFGAFTILVAPLGDQYGI